MNSMLEVIAPGSKCFIGDSEIMALVLAVNILPGNQICYEVAWWVGGERKTAFLEAFEVETEGAVSTQKIGFHR